MNIDQYLKENKERWATEVTNGRLIYPDENVVRFLAARKNNQCEKNKVALDFGCGAGRHSVVMLRMGYDVIGMDYNKECLEATKDRINECFGENRKNRFRAIQNHGITLDLDDNSVDYIVAWGSIFYNGIVKFKEVLCEMSRILQEDGELFFDIRTQRDTLYGQGEELEKDFFRLNKESGYEGFTYLFLSKEELKEVVEECGLQVVNMETYEFTKNNGNNLHSWYHVIAKKMA